MGANQSRTPVANEKRKLVIERLRELQVRDQADNEYVHVDEKAVAGTTKNKFKAPWTSLAIEDVGEWEHELLQDPKNRLVFRCPVSNFGVVQY
jgi:bleomycin hydrolase